MPLKVRKDSFELSKIELALSFLKDQKFNFHGTSIHSPIAFLIHAMNQVLKVFNEERFKKQWETAHLRSTQANFEKVESDLKNIQQETATMVTEFISAFASEAELELKVGELVGGLPFKSKDQRVNYAAQKWWLLREGADANA